MVQIDVVQVGVLATNCYVIYASGSPNCVVVDPGGEVAKIVGFLEENGLKPTGVVSTHAHADHTGAVTPLVTRYGCDFMIGKQDVQAAATQHEWLTDMLGDFQDPPTPTRQLEEGDVIDGDGFSISVLATPGHTQGSVCLYLDGRVLTGDTLFFESIGRFDLPGGDQDQEIASIKGKLFTLDESTVVLPGHGPSTTIGHEIANNAFVQ